MHQSPWNLELVELQLLQWSCGNSSVEYEAASAASAGASVTKSWYLELLRMQLLHLELLGKPPWSLKLHQLELELLQQQHSP